MDESLLNNKILSIYEFYRDNGYVVQQNKVNSLLKYLYSDFNTFKKEIKKSKTWFGWNSLLDLDLRNNDSKERFNILFISLLEVLDKYNISYPKKVKSLLIK